MGCARMRAKTIRFSRGSALLLMPVLVLGLLAAQPSFADAGHGVRLAAAAPATTTPPAGSISAWRSAVATSPSTGVGCFETIYPRLTWRRFSCQTPPPNAPRQLVVHQSHPPQAVGGGTDFETSASGTTSATGSFPFVTNTASSAGPTETDNGTSNLYSLQLNANHFSSSLCNQLPSPSECVGGQQFVYDSGQNSIYMQYWLNDSALTSTSTCPTGYQLYIDPPGKPYWSGCYVDSPWGYLAKASPSISTPPVSSLGSVQLTGSAVAGGNDILTMTVAGEAVKTQFPDISTPGAAGGLGLAGNWNVSEFGVFGDGGGSEADFNAGTSLQTQLTTVASAAPTCLYGGITGETNNLNLGGTPPAIGGTASSGVLVTTQTYGATETPSCADATTWGETHLITLSNDPAASSALTYNFQSTGDYTLARTSAFDVQAQQIPDPVSANLAINQEIGARVGSSDVAVCTNPSRLVVNGRLVSLASGGRVSVPGGAVSLSGTTYLIQDDNGDFVQAHLYQGAGNIGWLDANVGIGRWPAAVSGLLANAGTHVNEVRSSRGVVLAAPFGFSKFYDTYATSWRVPAGQSLLSGCDRKVADRNPALNFNANNLTPSQYRIGHSVCAGRGVEAALIDSCILDVATLGAKDTAQVYASLPADLTWGAITSGRGPTPPRPPTNVRASARNASAIVSFRPPASNGGSAITGYTVTASDRTDPAHGGQTAWRASGPITVTRLTSGDSYTFRVTATNAVGTSLPSAPSGAVTPVSTATFTEAASGDPGSTPTEGRPFTVIGYECDRDADVQATGTMTFTDVTTGTLIGTLALGPSSFVNCGQAEITDREHLAPGTYEIEATYTPGGSIPVTSSPPGTYDQTVAPLAETRLTAG
jgi:hypothetical protein